MSTHVPLRMARPLHRKCAIVRCSVVRPFSSSASLQKRSHISPGESKDPDQKAPSTLESEAQQAAQDHAVEDIGLLPGTFVRARGSGSGNWSYEWKWAKTKFRDWFSIKYYTWYMKKRGKLWNEKAKARSEATQYYNKIYQAFASKSETELQKFCLPGIISHFQERWAARPQDLVMSWKLHRIHLGSPRIVSNRMGFLPIPGSSDRAAPSAVRQVVLRISSRQELEVEVKREVATTGKESKTERLAKLAWKPEAAKEQSEGEGEGELEKPVTRYRKDVVEYIVLQKRVLKGNEDGFWKVWGFVRPTTLESLQEGAKLEAQAKVYNAAQMSVA